MVVETPKPLGGVYVPDPNVGPPDGLNYNFKRVHEHPDDTIGYFTLDLQATKTFEFGNGSLIQLRGDVLNVTNRENFATLFTNFDGTPPFYFRDGDLAGVPRTFKLSMNLRF